MSRAPVTGVLGSFEHIDGASDAIRELKGSGFSDLTVYSAMHKQKLEEAVGDAVSPVRLFTLTDSAGHNSPPVVRLLSYVCEDSGENTLWQPRLAVAVAPAGREKASPKSSRQASKMPRQKTHTRASSPKMPVCATTSI